MCMYTWYTYIHTQRFCILSFHSKNTLSDMSEASKWHIIKNNNVFFCMNSKTKLLSLTLIPPMFILKFYEGLHFNIVPCQHLIYISRSMFDKSFVDSWLLKKQKFKIKKVTLLYRRVKTLCCHLNLIKYNENYLLACRIVSIMSYKLENKWLHFP